MMKASILSVGALMVCSGAASAAINPIGPFSGSLSESFESFSPGTGLPLSIMGGQATLGSPNGGDVRTYGSWYAWFGPMTPSDGSNFVVQYGFPGRYDIDFATPVGKFGGYFENYVYDGSGYPSSEWRFYDSGGGLLGTHTNSGEDGDGILNWEGFESTGAPIARIEIDNYQMAIDGLQAEIPAPGSLALLGLGGLAAARRRRA